MNSEKSLTWEFLKNVAESLDSFRIRALIDGKDDILKAGIYTEDQYYALFFYMIDLEQLKYELLAFLKNKSESNLKDLKTFTTTKKIDLKTVLTLLALLKNEKLVSIEEIKEQIDADNENLSFNKLTDFIIKVNSNLPGKTVYEPVQVIFDAEICSGCGMCAGICPVNCIEIINGIGKVDDNLCIRCGLCYYICPRTFLPTISMHMTQINSNKIEDHGQLGPYIDIFSARTKIADIKSVCQDGGITSSCLYYLFNSKQINSAVGAKMSEDPWRPMPFLLGSKEDVISSAGTKYVNNPNLSLLNDKSLVNGNFAIVGVPCHMQALLKSRLYNFQFPSQNNVLYRLGIFCMESFSYEDGFLKICNLVDVNVSDVSKTDINKGKFFIYTNDGNEFSVPIKEITHLARPDCEVCYDLTSESSDISIGSIGSPSGWNTIIIRTPEGKKLYDELISNDIIESVNFNDVKPGLTLLKKIAKSKKVKCQKHLNEKRKENHRFPNY